jgi:hypothetical protein
MTFCMTTGLLKTAILDSLQCWKKNKFWGCLVGILHLSWVPKSWKTLLAFHWLLKQPHRTNSLEDTEFCASAKLLKTELDSTTAGSTKFWQLSQTETQRLPNTIPWGNSLRFPMVHSTTPNGKRIMSYDYRRMAGLLNRGNLSRPDLPAQIRILAKNFHDLSRKFACEKCC